MILRLILLLLVFSACRNTNTAEGTDSQEVSTYQEAQQRLSSNYYKGVVFTEEQQAAMGRVIQSYSMEQIKTDSSVRQTIRSKIETEILTPDQLNQWQKSLRAPVVIE